MEASEIAPFLLLGQSNGSDLPLIGAILEVPRTVTRRCTYSAGDSFRRWRACSRFMKR